MSPALLTLPVVVSVARKNSLGPCPEHLTCWVQSCQLGVKGVGFS